MASVTDSDFIDSPSLMGGFDMGISFDEFGENMKKFMELPIKYIDTAHNKAVGFVGDIHAMMCAPLPDNEVLNKGHVTLEDPSSDNVINESSPTSAAMELVASNEESSSLANSLIAAEDSFVGSDTHKIESSLTNLSEGGGIEVNEQCTLPADSLKTEISDSYTSHELNPLGETVDEEVLLCNVEKPSETCTSEESISLGRIVGIEDEVILWNPGNPVKPPPESTTMFQDYVSHEVNTDKMVNQVELHSSVHSESSTCPAIIIETTIAIANGGKQTELYSANDPEESRKHGDIMIFSGWNVSYKSKEDVSKGVDDPDMLLDDPMQFVEIDLQDDQETEIHNGGVSSAPQPKNTSFKKILIKSLSNKFRWSKNKRNLHQAAPIRSEEAANASYRAVSSSDDLEDDWELL